jgi:hypothetical protein
MMVAVMALAEMATVAAAVTAEEMTGPEELGKATVVVAAVGKVELLAVLATGVPWAAGFAAGLR